MHEALAGTRLGRYEIVALIDAGGMGEVYRAIDSQLGRNVAIKVLPAERIGDLDARARFEREGRAIAQLTHPHICTLYDVGADAERAYLVMELLSGKTLADRLLVAGTGGLPLVEALGIAIDVAGALAFAHRHQIVHRDVKPGNIMLTPTGAKLVDFGLAHLRRLEPGSLGLATETFVTAPHVVMGTVPYMAPEQLEGRADARADVFAFGSVVYEMLAGRRAFPGDTPSAIMAAIVRGEPEPLRSLRSEVSTALARIVRRCLEKDPDQRWQSAADLADELQYTRDTLRSDDERWSEDVASARRPNRRMALVTAAICLLALIGSAGAGFYVGRTRGAQSAEAYIDEVDLPPGTTHYAGIALSPDGTRLAIVTQSNTSARDSRLSVRTVGGDEWQLVSGAGPEIVRYPFWSPDSSSLAFFRDDKLVRADLPKFEPVVLCDAPDGRGGAWLDDGTLLFAPTPTSDLWRVSARGGSPSTLVRRGQGEDAVKYPVSAGGDRFLYWAQFTDRSLNEIRLASVSAPDRSISIVRSPRAAAFERGTLYYTRDRDVVGQRLDLASGQLTGDVQRVRMEGAPATNVGASNVAAGGGHVAIQTVRAGQFQLAWADRTGAIETRIGEPGAYREMDLSKDSRRLLVSERSSDGDRIWLIDLTSGARRLLVSLVAVSDPRWAPDEQAFAFRALTGRGGNAGLYQQRLDSDGPVMPLIEGNFNAYPIGWPATGGSFVWFRIAAGEPMPLGIFMGEGTARFGRAVSVLDARLSPDSERIAYAALESGLSEVYVDAFPVSTGPVQVSRGGGQSPHWRSDGRELLYVAKDDLMSVAIAPGQTSAASQPTRLFQLPSPEFAVADDGKRFLVAEPISQAHPTIRLLLNWASSNR